MFPSNVSVDVKASEPTFFSFMMTDVNHNNSFFHALIFREEVNDAEIDSADFDIVSKFVKKHEEKRSHRKETLKA